MVVFTSNIYRCVGILSRVGFPKVEMKSARMDAKLRECGLVQGDEKMEAVSVCFIGGRVWIRAVRRRL